MLILTHHFLSGGYYLTSVYASLCYIQSEPEAAPSSGLTHQVKESLKEWSNRRSTESKNDIKQVSYWIFFCRIIVFFCGIIYERSYNKW